MQITRRKLLLGLPAAAACGRRTPEPPPHEAPPIAPSPPPEGFHAGMSLAHVHGQQGYGSQDCAAQLQLLAQMGVRCVSLTPFAYQRMLTDTDLLFGAGLDRSLTDDHLLRAADQARAAGLEVALKPHVWSDAFWKGQTSRQDIDPGSAAGWVAWFSSYTRFAVHYAALAERMGAAMYCVGLEYLAATEQNPGAWSAVAAACREVFSGELTYAANWWREAELFTDWAAFDLIGVNAYPPLTRDSDPTPAALLAAWRGWLDAIELTARAAERPVVLTEAGIRAVRGAAAEPWAQSGGGALDLGLQADTYEALLAAASERDWLRGIFWWKWFTAPHRDSDAFAPRAPAQAVLRRWWASDLQAAPRPSADLPPGTGTPRTTPASPTGDR